MSRTFNACVAATAFGLGSITACLILDHRPVQQTVNIQQAPPVVQVQDSRTLAERNNNPLNVKGTAWQGQVSSDKHGFAIFSAPEWGVRAAANILLNYMHRHGIDTVQGVVCRFSETDQATYARYVADRIGVQPDEKLDILQHLPALLQAMARLESGTEWPEHLFTGYDLLAAAYRKGGE